MSIIEAKKKWGVAPAFNLEFVAYYEDREKRIKDLKKQVIQDKKDFQDLRNSESEITVKFDKVNKVLTDSCLKNDKLRKKVELVRNLLSIGGADIPKAVPKVVFPKASSTNASSSNIKARSTAYFNSLSSQASPIKHVKICGICGKSHDQHLLAHCDTCQHHYHLGCLAPPLTRMPKKSKQYGWSCSECYPDSSDDEKQTVIENFEDANDGGGQRRRQRRQAAASKALQMASSSANNSEDENRIIKKVMQESAAAAAASASAQKTASAANSNGLEEKREDLIARAEAGAGRKRKRREEKARRKAEKKAQKKRIIEEQNGGLAEEVEEDSDIEIIEDDNGVCTVSIQPRPIKLTIKTNGHQTPSGARRNSSQGSSSKPKDTRSKCDKCQLPGQNNNLVRCDECRNCYHFGCLIPPVTKSPKRPGWGWHCNECDPSDRDSDWHLD